MRVLSRAPTKRGLKVIALGPQGVAVTGSSPRPHEEGIRTARSSRPAGSWWRSSAGTTLTEAEVDVVAETVHRAANPEAGILLGPPVYDSTLAGRSRSPSSRLASTNSQEDTGIEVLQRPPPSRKASGAPGLLRSS